MAEFNRFDICEAYLAFEWDWHNGGWLRERPTNQRRKQSTSIQLSRIKFQESRSFSGWESLSENGKEIYQGLANRYNLHCEYA